MMKNYVCTTCGVQYAASVEEPVSCHICDEEAICESKRTILDDARKLTNR